MREQLVELIRAAEDDKLKAIYILLEAELQEPSDWTANESIVAEIDRRTDEYRAGKVTGIPWKDVKAQILSKGK